MRSSKVLDEIKESEKIISVDFDGVIWPYDKGWLNGEIYDGPFPETKPSLEKLKEGGYKIVVCSTRAASEKGLRQIYEFMTMYELPYDEITSKKVMCKVHIDDKCIRFTDWKKVLKMIEKEVKQWR